MNPYFHFLKMTNTEKYLYRTTLKRNATYFLLHLDGVFFAVKVTERDVK